MVGKWELVILMGLGLLLLGERMPVVGPLTFRLFRNSWFYRVYRPWVERHGRAVLVGVFLVALVLVYWIRWHTSP